jgi:chemotaxis protein MotB
MEHKRKRPPSEEGPSAPLWMVTFSDCMNLLLTFFVLLVTFSSYDTDVLTDLGSAFSRVFPGISFNPASTELDKSALLPSTQLTAVEAHAEGSEKPTLARGPEDNIKPMTQTADFRTRKAFFADSMAIFWGKGTAISSEGKETLETLALFLKAVPSRVVISERSLDNQKSDPLGLDRAWAVIEYLTTIQGLDRKRFNISVASTLSDTSSKDIGLSSFSLSPENGGAKVKDERTLEIVLLERSMYN